MKGVIDMCLVSPDGYPIEDEQNSSVRSPFVAELGCASAIVTVPSPEVALQRRLLLEMVGMKRIIKRKGGEFAD